MRMTRAVAGLSAFLVGLLVDIPISQAETCGGVARLSCAAPYWCDFSPNTCDRPEREGTCVVSSQVCTMDYRPVCGCDGKTYSNRCARQQAKVSEAHDGPCKGR